MIYCSTQFYNHKYFPLMEQIILTVTPTTLYGNLTRGDGRDRAAQLRPHCDGWCSLGGGLQLHLPPPVQASLGQLREGLIKKKRKISHLGGGSQDKIGSFSHFFYFFSFYVLNHANLQRNFF